MAVVAILDGLIPESAEAIEPYVTNNQSASPMQELVMDAKHNIEDQNEVILAAFKKPPENIFGRDTSLDAKKRYDEADGIYILPDSGPVKPDMDSTGTVESIMVMSSGLKAQHNRLLTNKKSAINAANAIKKLANGTMKDIKKVQGMKTVFEARQSKVRVYFTKDGDTIQILAPCLKSDQVKVLDFLNKILSDIIKNCNYILHLNLKITKGYILCR